MLDFSCDINVISFSRSVNHLDVICRIKAIFGGAFTALADLCAQRRSWNSQLDWGRRAHASSWLESVPSCLQSADAFALAALVCNTETAVRLSGIVKRQSPAQLPVVLSATILPLPPQTPEGDTNTGSYSSNPLFNIVVESKVGFICCMECSQHIYI